MRTVRILITGALVAVLAACGLEPASQAVPEVEAGKKLAKIDSLEGARIVTTSKDFTEQLIFGRMASLVLAAKGAEVSDQTNAKGSFNARQAMLDGSADVAWEYTGSAWVAYMGHVDIDPETGLSDGVKIGDPDEIYEAVKKEDVSNNIDWGQPADLNNTYAMAVKKDDAEKYDLEKLSDLNELPAEKQTYCLENEFQRRSDGWPGMTEAYDINNVEPIIMDAGVIYSKIGRSCNIGVVYDTDGRVPANDLVTLEDDKGYFPMYEPAITVRSEINEKYPQITEAFDLISKDLNTDVMRELNARVDVNGEEPIDVARDWLTKKGYLAGA